jgi:hypothetical protein
MRWTKNCVEPDLERNFEAGVAFRTGTTGGLSKNDRLWHETDSAIMLGEVRSSGQADMTKKRGQFRF